MKKTILFIILAIGIIITGCTVEECKIISDCEETQIPKGKGILDIEIFQYAINIYDNSELFFDYWIFNYGDTEAKDITIRCKLKDAIGNTLVSVTDYYGNLASNSGEFGELVTKNPSISITKEYVGYCYVENCSNCEILYKRILKLIESYEG